MLSSGKEWDVYLALETSISYVTTPNEWHSLNNTYATGRLSKCVHKIIPPNAGNPNSKEYGLPVERYTQNKRYFALDSWYIQTPFIESQQLNDSEESRLVKRRALKLSDFNLRWLAAKSVRFTQSDLKRYMR